MPLTHVPGPAFSRHPAHIGITRSNNPQAQDHHHIINPNLPGSLDEHFLTLVRCGAWVTGHTGWCRTELGALGAFRQMVSPVMTAMAGPRGPCGHGIGRGGRLAVGPRRRAY